MLYNYLALAFFIIIGLLIPSSIILTSRLLGRRVAENLVKNAPYESGEETVGSSRDIDNEYLPYFMLFLPFEVVIAIVILWSVVARGIGYNTSIEIIVLTVLSAAMALVGYKFVRGKNG
ncbi:MAG TPA: NADH-quinone oxidoreductase subunit A [Candidatus Baltobacteraceae bacterium]|nr:NADH-quinone oxidoreductase subunit A [Candidatus Baltobacteraceae bacterium]